MRIKPIRTYFALKKTQTTASHREPSTNPTEAISILLEIKANYFLAIIPTLFSLMIQASKVEMISEAWII